MDKLWFGILAGMAWVAGVMDTVFGTLHFFGPAFTVAVVALVTVLLQKLLTRLYRPPRYAVLRKRYYELRQLRDEASKWEDREKAGRLARNIDQAELNQAYYNYFFEGLMISLLTKYMPFFALLAYVNDSYRTERLLELFDRPFLFSLGGLNCGSVPFFTVCVLLMHVVWFFTAPRLRPRKD
ncbi:MAG: hypothetical protein GY838_07820 [bacterium]|nr:hypothetical protein [bacterium]